MEGALDEGPIEHGLVIRLLERGPGVIVEVAIPPGEVNNLPIVSCHYDTPTRRRPGFTPEDW